MMIWKKMGGRECQSVDDHRADGHIDEGRTLGAEIGQEPGEVESAVGPECAEWPFEQQCLAAPAGGELLPGHEERVVGIL